VENDVVGAPVGLMDPMVISVGRLGEALFIDCDTLAHRAIPLPRESLAVRIIPSGISHRNAGEGYRKRREECQAACDRLGIRSLRSLDMLHPPDQRAVSELPEPLLRRVRHVYTEDTRVHQAAKALRRRDFVELGRLLDASHASLRDDFEVSLPEIDALVERVRAEPGCYGARLTGGGFGGSIVALNAPERS
jgi:galactokinase